MGLTRSLTRGGLTRPLVRSVLGGIGGGGADPQPPEGYAAMKQTDGSLMRSDTTPLYYKLP